MKSVLFHWQQQNFPFHFCIHEQRQNAFSFLTVKKFCLKLEKKKAYEHKNYDYNLRFVANLFVVPVNELNQSAVSLIRKMV